MTKQEKIREEFKALCRGTGLRCTPQRLAVFSYMRENHCHPEVETVWREVKRGLPSITRESVFRILSELCDLGMVQRMDTIINARFDGQNSNHGHFICENCGAVTDFPLGEITMPEIPADFHPKHTELRITGLCAGCLAEKKAKKQLS